MCMIAVSDVEQKSKLHQFLRDGRNLELCWEFLTFKLLLAGEKAFRKLAILTILNLILKYFLHGFMYRKCNTAQNTIIILK